MLFSQYTLYSIHRHPMSELLSNIIYIIHVSTVCPRSDLLLENVYNFLVGTVIHTIGLIIQNSYSKSLLDLFLDQLPVVYMSFNIWCRTPAFIKSKRQTDIC